MFDNRLEVGQLAVIINTAFPENRHLIGTVVKVEAFWQQGQDVTEFFPEAIGSGFTIIAQVGTIAMVVVSGCNYTARTGDHKFSMKSGWTNFNRANLMPLPPLDETETQKEKELDLA